MYYYIFDVCQCKNKVQAEKIKDYLAFLGIGGEYVFPSQARTAAELVRDALSRDFSTIVAIGNDALINNVATELVGERAAFGIVPLNASESINQLVNGFDWRQAASNLRYRKIKEIKLGQMENGRHFLTEVQLDVSGAANVTLEFDTFIAQSKVKRLVISNLNPNQDKTKLDLLDIYMSSEGSSNGSIVKRFLKYFDGNLKDPSLSNSFFQAKRVRIFSQKNLNFTIDREAVGNTPQLICTSPKPLRLIINREVPANIGHPSGHQHKKH